MDTIVALSTAVGKSAIAIIRMSGEKSVNIAKKVFKPFPSTPNLLKVGQLKTPFFADNAMCVYFVSPFSYTGEDMVEFHCHGGMALVSAVIDTLLKAGARMAANGEFSRRAFLNGKMNLAQTEGIIEMIDAETQSAVKAGENLLKNKLGEKTVELQDRLTDLIGESEVALDYPEEDLELQTKTELSQSLQRITGSIKSLLSTVESGKLISYGIDVSIVGKPNVGKSSLLNALLGYERAIVSSFEGTTRDTVADTIAYKDIKFNFIDTAGLRNSQDEVENLGIERTKNAMRNADLILLVFDGAEEKTVDEFNAKAKVIKVYNKSDLTHANVDTADAVSVSAKTGHNVEKLKEKIYRSFRCGEIDVSSVILTNERHIQCLRNAYSSLKKAQKSLKETTADCTAVFLRDAWNSLGEITGTTATEDIIDRIYSRFCLGK